MGNFVVMMLHAESIKLTRFLGLVLIILSALLMWNMMMMDTESEEGRGEESAMENLIVRCAINWSERRRHTQFYRHKNTIKIEKRVKLLADSKRKQNAQKYARAMK